MIRRSPVERAQFDEIYKNPSKSRFPDGFGEEFEKARQQVSSLKKVMMGDQAYDLVMRDKLVPSFTKVYGKIQLKPLGAKVEPGSFSKLVLTTDNNLSVRTRIANRCVRKAEDPYISSTVRKLYKAQLSLAEAKRQEILKIDRKTLDGLIMKGELPGDELIRRLLFNGYHYWSEPGISKPTKKKFYRFADERQTKMVNDLMERASLRSREQYARMLKNSGTLKPNKPGFVSKLFAKIAGVASDALIEKLSDEAGSTIQGHHFVAFPIIGPVPPEPSPSESDDIFLAIISGYEKRGLTPPTYDELKAGEKDLTSILQSIRDWIMADQKTFWKQFCPLITPEAAAAEIEREYAAEATTDSTIASSGQAEDPTPTRDRTGNTPTKDQTELGTVAIGIAEQILMLQVYLLWAERVPAMNPPDPWLWELAKDKTDLVADLATKYLDEGHDSMYDFVGSYSYRGKRELPRYVMCGVVNEALESILVSVFSADLGEVRDPDDHDNHDDPEDHDEPTAND